MRIKTRGRPLTNDALRAVRAFVSEHGESEALNRTGVSEKALFRALAGLPVLPGTAELLQRIAKPTRDA